MTTRKELVEALRVRYRSAAFGERIKILDEFVAMTVDELAAAARLDLKPNHTPWLSMPQPQRHDIDRLAWLCRMEPAQLLRLDDGGARDPDAIFLYCHDCLFLNPWDVTATQVARRPGAHVPTPSLGRAIDRLLLGVRRQGAGAKRVSRAPDRSIDAHNPVAAALVRHGQSSGGISFTNAAER